MFTGYSENRRSRQMLYNRGNTGPGVHQVVSTAFVQLSTEVELERTTKSGGRD